MRTKLSIAFICLLACLVFACESQQTSDGPKDPPKTYTEAEKAELASGVHKLFQDHCAECHDYGAKKVYDKIDYILDHDKLVKSKIVNLEQPEASELYEEIAEGEMPRKFDADGKPKIKVKLAKEQADLVLNWLKAGAPAWK
jgi:RNA-binding protein YhbY